MNPDGWNPNRIGPVAARLAAIAVAALVALPSAALAQSQGVTRDLGDDGEWTITEEPDRTAPEGQLHFARQALAEGRLNEARSRAKRFIEDYPDHALAAEAYLVRADALYLAEEYYKALYDYEFIARMYPASEVFAIALEREYDIALLFAQGKKRKFWGIRCVSAVLEAEELLIRIQERLPGSKLAEKAGRALADMYFRQRDMESASTAYDLYLRNHPDAADRPEAMERLIGSHLATYKGPRFSLRGLDEARVWLNTMEDLYPAQAQQIRSSAIKDRIEEAHAERMLVDAEWYLRRRDEVSADFILSRLLRRYSSTVAAARAYHIMLDRGWLEAPETEPGIEDAAAAPDEPAIDIDDVNTGDADGVEGGTDHESDS